MKKLILHCALSPGDIVMLTAAVRDLHHWYPGQFQTDVRTRCPDLWQHNPWLTPMADDDPDAQRIDCSYPLIDHANEAPYHCLHGFIEFLNARLKLSIKPTSFRGDIHLSAQEKGWCSQVHELTGADTRFWIVAAGGKHDVTIKWWDTARYQQVIEAFLGQVLFVQVGQIGHHHPRLDGALDLRGKTSLRQLVRLVHHAEGVLCPVTLLMHLAAAVGSRRDRPDLRPCVVVAGGREPAHWEAYPGHQFIHTNGMLPCCVDGGCWKDRVHRLRDGNERDRPSRLCENVIDRLPRCMDLITAPEVVRRIRLYFEGGTARYLSSRQWVAGQRAVAATLKNPYDDQPLNLHSAGLSLDNFIHTMPPCTAGFVGRGIVICGGGVRYFTNAWVCIHMLRRLGCRLPVQLWYLGRQEMDQRMQALVAPLGVACIDALRWRRKHPARTLRGWELKPYAIVNCPFREVLLLDADNVPVVNPEFLFETAQFRRRPAIFWPDFRRPPNPKARAIWRSCGLRPPAEPEFETGQVLVDKARCWPALRLSLWFNEHSDFYYRHIYGDKETFHLAFRKMKQPYFLMPAAIHALTGTMCQHDFAGRRIFQHRNTRKWQLHRPNPRVQGFLFEKECRAYLAELRTVWDGRINQQAGLGTGAPQSTKKLLSAPYLRYPQTTPAPQAANAPPGPIAPQPKAPLALCSRRTIVDMALPL
jgi:ADP-heptose:LPS heptosyltransferase